MTKAEPGGMMFSSNRGDMGAPDRSAAPVMPPDAPHLDQIDLQKILDRIEQLEFALAESVLHVDAQEAASDPTPALVDLAARVDAASVARADEAAVISSRLTVLETGTASRIAPIEAMLQTTSQQLQAVLTGISQVTTRFDKLEAQIATLPGQSALAALKTDLTAQIDQSRPPVVTRLDALAGMLTTLTGDVKMAQDLGLDMTLVTEPLMARMDRLDATADQRQRDLNRDLEDLGAKSLPNADLTSIRESYARLMVALQGMHQAREEAEADILSQISTLSGDLNAIPDRVDANAAQQGREIVEGIIGLPANAGPEAPTPAINIDIVKEAIAQQMVAIDGWMTRQEVLQSAISDLLETLVDQGRNAGENQQLGEDLKTLIAAGQFSARKQAEGSEVRLSQQLSSVAALLGGRDTDPGQDNAAMEPAGLPDATDDENAPTEEALCSDDRRLIDALQGLRRIIADAPEEGAERQIADQTLQLRLTLAETLASMQAGKALRI